MKNALIVGGTGTLGNEIARQLNGIVDLTIFSRDECKQQAMRRMYPNARYVLGDVRDIESLRRAFFEQTYDVVFHVAALKHVDVVENNPEEGIATNIIGTINVAKAAREAYVPHVVFTSTDKAVDPINIYGMTKAVSERYLLGLNGEQERTRFSVYRWGNVVGSRGSVVHTFAETLRVSGRVQITDKRMTRFWIHIEDAVRFMLSTYHNAPKDKVLYPEMGASFVVDLARATALHMGLDSCPFEDIGMRPGEKIHECMDRDRNLYSNNCRTLTVHQLKDMVARVL